MRNKLFRVFLALALGIFSLPIIAQTGTITGNVKDNAGNLMPGTTVYVKNISGVGTITNADGNYTLNGVPEGTVTIVATFVGYSDSEQEVTIKSGESLILNFTLTEQTQLLDEIIVIGYGVQKKSDKTGAVAQVSGDDLSGGSLTDPIQGLQAKAAGVTISKKGGDPNSGFSIRIRGSSGFDSNTQPLFVIDGVPGADPTTVAPEDIESYDILKDAASTAIYGSRGANGVIFITTKSGNSESGQIKFNTSISIDQVANTIDLLSASELRQFVSDNNMEFIDGGADVNWQDQIYKTGISQNYNLSFSGGSENYSHYASITRSDWDGVMKGTAKERTIGKINLTHNGLNNRLKLSGTLQGTIEKNDYESYGGFGLNDIIYQALSHNPTDPVYGEDGDYYRTIRAFNYENPLAVINLIDNIRDAKRFLSNIKADLEIFEGFTGTINTGYIRNDHESSYFRPKNVYATADNGWGSKSYNNFQRMNFESYFTYKKSIGDHSLNVLGGYSWSEDYNNSFYAQAADPQSNYLGYNALGTFIDVTNESIGSWAEKSRLIGFFGRVQYNLGEKYYATASIRRDGSSKFGKNNRWGTFPTFSAGWNIHNEEFFNSFDVIDKLKLRASYGVSGNQEIGNLRNQFIFFGSSKPVINPETGEEVTSFSPSYNGNPDLQWEETTEINIGIDFALYNNRINGSIEVYQKLTDKLLAQYFVPVPPNLVDRTYLNSGSLNNRGIEFNVQAFIVDNANFKWKSTFTASHNKTKISDLGDYIDENFRKDGYLSGRGLVGDNNYVTGNIQGGELGAFYLPVFVKLSDDGKFLYKSKSGGITRELSEAQREVVGSPLPDLEMGWSNTFTFFNNWTVDMTFRSMIGNDVYNATRMFFDYPGNLPSLNAVPEAIEWYEQGRTNSPAIADIYVEDGSFIKLDYLSLGYNFNLKNDWVKRLKVYVSGNNLITLTKYSGVDPETTYEGLSFGIDQYNVYPKTRSVSFGISATF